MIDLKDKNIWITGSARGLGLEIAKQFADEDANIFFGSRRHVDYYIEKGYFDRNFVDRKNVHFLSVDVGNRHSVDTACEVIESCCKKVDILINNAGIISVGAFEDIEPDEFTRVMNINCLGSLHTARAVLPKMKKVDSGAIINITSVVTEKAFPQNGVYSASKAAQAALFRSLREELRKTNVKVINIAPGATDTEIWAPKLREKYGQVMMKTEELAEAIVNTAKLSLQTGVLIEEMTIRPQGGDL